MLGALDLPFRAQAEAAAAGLVGGAQARRVLHQHAAGGKVGAWHVREKISGGGIGIAHKVDRGGADLARIVRRDAGRHADRDARGTIGKQIGESARQHQRLVFLAVVGGAEIHRIVVDAGEQRTRDLGEPRFGVTHGSGVVAVDVAEIALALDQRIAGGKILREPHQRVIDGDLAVRMELADHVADHAGAFLEAGGGIEAQQVHGEDQPAMHRLQPVAHVGQRARHDGGEGIDEVALRQRVGEPGVLDVSGRVVGHRVQPTIWLARSRGARVSTSGVRPTTTVSSWRKPPRPNT